MGGAKCTYRTCSVKSDGKIHMFHYPVFDKVRCHQWLTNAQRLDFLNLKVSQLKNRVVCQHHFKHDSFMNYKMDKLRYDAVPTENGPFCDPSELTNKVEALPICPDEIDNDQLTFREKQAKFSVKYGDFLINSEIDSDKLSTNIQQENNEKHKPSVNKLSLIIQQENNEKQKPSANKLTTIFQQKNNVKHKPSVNKLSSIIQQENNEKQKPSVTEAIEVEVPSITKQDNMALITTSHRPQAKNKVCIISEKKILTPVSVKGKMEPVPTSTVIFPRRPKPQPVEPVKIEENIENMNIVFQNTNESTVDLANSEITFYPQTLIEPQDLQLVNMNQPVSFPHVIQNYDPSESLAQIQILNPQSICDSSQTMILTELQPSNNPVESTPLKNKNNEINKPSNQTSPKSLLKNKIPPERVAAIEQKRKFNKKLRDMIEFCLDDSPEKVTKESCILNKTKNRAQEIDTLKIIEELKKPMEVKRIASQVKDTNNESSKKRVSSFLSEEPNLPSISEYNLASIEARLKRMEENLSRRIDQNTQTIGELKEIIQTGHVHKKSVMTQCKEDEDTSKKQLFKEISQFLSPEANSLIYEELFLNKFSKKPVEKAARYPTKRRKILT